MTTKSMSLADAIIDTTASQNQITYVGGVEIRTPQNVHEAIIAVRMRVPYVQKDDGKKLGYNFVGIENLINKLKPAMNEFGLTIYPIPQAAMEVPRNPLLVSEEYETKAGNKMHRPVVRAVYELYHAPSKTSLLLEALGCASDSADKAINKAHTAALKIILRQVFLLESGDNDPETVEAESLGIDESLYDIVEKNLTSAHYLDGVGGLHERWRKTNQRGFSPNQLDSLMVAYNETFDRLTAENKITNPKAK